MRLRWPFSKIFFYLAFCENIHFLIENIHLLDWNVMFLIWADFLQILPFWSHSGGLYRIRDLQTDLPDINQQYQVILLIWSNKTDISSDNLSKINQKPEFRSNQDCLRIHIGAVWSFDKLLLLNESLWSLLWNSV